MCGVPQQAKWKGFVMATQEYQFEIIGETPLIQHCGFRCFRKYDFCKDFESIKKKRGKNITDADAQRVVYFDTFQSFWCDAEDREGKRADQTQSEYEANLEPDIPVRVIRADIEKGARAFKEGGKVRSGMRVKSVKFQWDWDLGVKMVDLAVNPNIHFTVPVKVGTSKILRTRAIFRDWGAKISLIGDTQFLGEDDIQRWLEYSGNYIGIGDWRPDKSGEYGRFRIVE